MKELGYDNSDTQKDINRTSLCLYLIFKFILQLMFMFIYFMIVLLQFSHVFVIISYDTIPSVYYFEVCSAGNSLSAQQDLPSLFLRLVSQKIQKR